MKIILSLMIISISFQTFAEPAIFNPIQDRDLEQLDVQQIDEIGPIELVKVKVFPHDGPYATPQGIETSMGQAVVTSEGACLLIKSTGAGQSTGPGTTLSLQAQDFSQGPGTIKCDSPMTIVREGAKALRYRGTFFLHNVDQKLVIVNVVSFKDYLKGVVPSEMSTSWPLESLKAQAIAARTYATNQILHARRTNPKGIFDLDDTVMFQAYQGLSVEHPATSAAVDATDEVNLKDSEGRAIIAYFSADSGGFTESAENVWGGVALPYTVSKSEIYDLRLVKSAWTMSLTLAQINAKLVSKGIVPKDFKLARFEISEYTMSGRMKAVMLISDTQHELKLSGEKFRYGMGFRSSLLKMLEISENEFQFNGLGYGHGVGMNQWGAKVLAESLGWDHKQILGFYYDGVQL